MRRSTSRRHDDQQQRGAGRSARCPRRCPRGCRRSSPAAPVRTTTAPIRAGLAVPGLCWSGEVTGSLPATVGPSLAIGSRLVWHASCVARCGEGPAIGLASRAGRHYRRRGRRQTRSGSVWRTPDCLLRGTCGARSPGPGTPACGSTPRAGSILCDPWVNPAYFASWFPFPDNSQLDWETPRADVDYLYVSPPAPGPLRRRRTCSGSCRKKATVLLPEFPTTRAARTSCGSWASPAS